ncbi:NACHT domain-containing protein [Kutzneria albida]|uniref:NACHT domain-containing protein n=1 Tax=Kutzneria albida DSM 43870 TaxID=1449976 RepID=W5WKK4_9PSEU|nr:NACHT domain-containing protein [Kutzneria albida]AHI01097.1 hypothetical protein KALB_7739 [Kutzneria albida DSM 43870]
MRRSGNGGARNELTGTARDVVQIGAVYGDVHLNRADSPAEVDHAVEQLRQVVFQQWAEEAGLRSLRRPEPLRVRWSSTGRPVAAAPGAVIGRGALPGRPIRLRLHGDVHQVVAAFLALPAQQLVVIGEPGAGKTVLALLLTLGLLGRAAPEDPVPVLLNASTWNPRAEHLHTWLARRLIEDYPALTDAPQLIAQGRVMVVLDGLDEMPAALHPAAINALDRASSDNRPLVVTCRSAEYEAAVAEGGTVLSRAAVVEIEPVELVDAAAFLTAASPSARRCWPPVVDRLAAEPGLPLAQALTSPLMLALARTAYGSAAADPVELLDPAAFPDRTAVERHLLDAFVPAAYREEPAAPGSPRVGLSPHDPGQARDWLRFLAGYLDRRGTQDLAWWELAHAVPRPVLGLAAMLCVASVSCLFVWAVAELGAWPGALGEGFLTAGSASSLLCGLVGGLVMSFGLFRWRFPARMRLRLRRRWREVSVDLVRRYLDRRAVVWMLAWLGTGLAVGLALGGTRSIPFGLAAGAVIGAGIWLFGGLAGVLSVPVELTETVGAVDLLRVARRSSISQAALVGVGGSTVLWAGLWIAFEPATGFPFDLVLGRVLVLGWMISAVGGFLCWVLLFTVWGPWLIARLWLPLTGVLPWRLVGFLGDAHRRGVLRQAGAVYQFRHALVQHHLSGGDRGNP